VKKELGRQHGRIISPPKGWKKAPRKIVNLGDKRAGGGMTHFRATLNSTQKDVILGGKPGKIGGRSTVNQETRVSSSVNPHNGAGKGKRKKGGKEKEEVKARLRSKH